jgi:hypothetical protein
MALFAKKTVPIFGLVGLLHLSVTTDSEKHDFDLLGYARELHGRLEAEIEQQVQQTLGAEFEVSNVEFRKGSIEVYVAITAVGTFFMGFSRYESFVKSVNLLVSQLRGLLQRFFGQAPVGAPGMPVSVTGSWQPSPVITAANQSFDASSGLDSCQMVLAYLLLSHAALLGTLLWLVVRHLR